MRQDAWVAAKVVRFHSANQKARMLDETNNHVTFADVAAGCDEATREAANERFRKAIRPNSKKLWYRGPRGVLMVGPPVHR